jgi:low affinity Fe/Cu permease
VDRKFARFAMWFSSAFGSAKAFTITTSLVLVWLAVMPWIGIARWNASLGLAGNTAESTLELFLAIAVQYTGNRIEKRQEAHMERIERLERAIAQHLGVPVDPSADSTDT